MNRRYVSVLVGLIGLIVLLHFSIGISQQRMPAAADVVQGAQTPRQVQITRPEQQPTPHDQSDIVSATKAPPSSTAFETQPDQGKILGFDFARDPAKANQSELRGEVLFFGKAQCATCHVPPFYLDNKMHDLKVERFVNEPPDGPIKTFTLRGIKDSPPYLHDGRLLTLEDTIEFFNLVLSLQRNEQEKKDLVAFMRQL
jgi:cytochrome c peroxidase